MNQYQSDDSNVSLNLNDNWVEETLSKMTLEEKAGQLVFPNVYGTYMSEDSPEYQRIKSLVEEKKVGGLIFFSSELYEQAILTNKMQSLAKIPLLIAADYEHGVSMRIDGATASPNTMAIGAADDEKLTYELGKITALEARAIGVHQNYAPVADVNNNSYNPIINIRSYGETPELVAKHSNAFLKGLQENGMIATSKHFPGHGNTNIDSHLDLPVITSSIDELNKIELYPFKENIKAGVMSIMVGHLAVPSIEGDSGVPASLSQKIITDLLKNQLGFNGLIVTDALNMHGITNYYSTAKATIEAIKAGNDCVLFPEDPVEAIDAIISAVKKGIIEESRLDASVRKILKLKKWLGLDKNRFVDVDKISSIVGKKEHLKVAIDISRKSITLLKNENNLLPLSQNPKIKYAHISIIDSKNENDGEYFRRLIRERIPQVQSKKILLNSNEEDYHDVLRKCNESDVVILSIYLKVRSYQGTIWLIEKQSKLVNLILSLQKPVVMISHGNPYLLSEFPQVDAYLNNYGDTKFSEQAVAEALFGEIDIQGKSPVSIPNAEIKIGSGLKIPKSSLLDENYLSQRIIQNEFARVDSMIDKAIQDSTFPGGVLLIAKDGKIIYHNAYGHLTYDIESTKTQKNTIYDLASLTKVLATTTAAMILVSQKKLDLTKPVQFYLPEFTGENKNKVLVQNLLLHNSGLPAWKKFYNFCKNEDDVIQDIMNTKLEYEPGTKTIYSDLGMILMGKIIEQVSGKKLDEFCKEEIFNPLSMRDTYFNPPKELKDRIAPTEIDNYWRMKQIHGEVHDETSYLLNGVAGHAGLFSTAKDIAVLLQMILQRGFYQGRRFIDSQVVDLFTTRFSENSSRALGWDTKSDQNSAGKFLSQNSIGHTGFTGTSCWVDKERNLIIIFLSNRVYPTRENAKIIKFRPLLHDEIVKIIDREFK
ncbi:MAG: glycoside hydrolase family 3 N-terminal domain-containing protein [Ignavibacteria bacterium]